MKIEPGDYILWGGKLAQVVGIAEHPTAHLRIVREEDKNHCPTCSTPYETDISIVMDSPLFRQMAKPVPTMED